MVDLLKQILISPAGSFGFVAAVVVLVVWFAFWLHGKFVAMLANHEHLARQCSETETGCKAVCDRLDKRIESLRDDLHLAKADLQYIKNMMNLQINTPALGQASMVQAHSPLSLTVVGQTAARDMRANDVIAVRWDSIKAKMDAEIPAKNPYDIQTYCLEKIPVCPEQFFDAATIDAFKVYAFNNGRTLFECLKVIGILVRDAYFKAVGIIQEGADAPSPSSAAGGCRTVRTSCP